MPLAKALIEIGIGSDKIVFYDAMFDTSGSSPSHKNDATLSFTLYSADGQTTVDADSTNVTMDYVTDSNGTYEGTLVASVTETLTNLATYWIKISVTSEPKDVRWLECQAVKRGKL